MSRNELHVTWFSAGVSSAVATKLALPNLDKIIYIHIDDQHPDSLRFVKDCEKWFDREIEIRQSPHKNVETVCLMSGYLHGPGGAKCTEILKKRVRKDWEEEHCFSDFVYYWGFDFSEQDRSKRLCEAMPEPRYKHRFPLIEHRIKKAYAHTMLSAAGIKRPVMYDLGYHNNNCIGCLKGGAGYWNKIREDFPDVFAARMALEHTMGNRILTRYYLDELEPAQGRHAPPIVGECGIFCELALNSFTENPNVHNET